MKSNTTLAGLALAALLAATGAQAQTGAASGNTNGAGSHGSLLGGMAKSSAGAQAPAASAPKAAASGAPKSKRKPGSVDPMGGVNNRTGTVGGSATAGGAPGRTLVGDDAPVKSQPASGAGTGRAKP